MKEALIVLWEASDRICGKRLKALLPSLMEAMERHGYLQLEDGVRTQPLAMSAATIDRQLRPSGKKPVAGVRGDPPGKPRPQVGSSSHVCGLGESLPATWRWIWWCIAGRGRKAASCIPWY